MKNWIISLDEVARLQIINLIDYIYMKLYNMRQHYDCKWYKDLLMYMDMCSRLSDINYMTAVCLLNDIKDTVNLHSYGRLK